MPLEPPEVARLAGLARLSFTASELEQAGADLNNIFGLIESMRAVDVSGLTPMAHALALTQRLREDHVTEGDARAALQPLAPAMADGLYLVPRVIE